MAIWGGIGAALPERAAIAARLKELFYVDSQGMPETRGDRVFYTRRSGTQEKNVAYWRLAAKGANDSTAFRWGLGRSCCASGGSRGP